MRRREGVRERKGASRETWMSIKDRSDSRERKGLDIVSSLDEALTFFSHIRFHQL